MRTAGIITVLLGLVVGLQVQAQNDGSSSTNYDSYSAPAPAPNGASSYHYVKRTFEEPLFHIAPVFGVTYSTFTGGSGNYSFGSSTGYEGGMDVLIGRGDLKFETGLIYAERGSKETYSSSYSNLSWSQNFQNQYLEIPLMANYSWQVSKETHLFVKGGLVVAFLQNASGDISTNQPSYGYYSSFYSPTAGKSTSDYFSTTDVRYAVGLGSNVQITRSMSWVVQADYEVSTNKISTSQPDAYGNVNSMGLSMSTYGLNTGLNFSL